MIVRVKTLQDKEFNIWKDEIEFIVKNRIEMLKTTKGWVDYFNNKGLDVRIQTESIEEYDYPCTQL